MINYSKKQAGGTFLGIIIGLIIGLAIAVVVAVTITKTSMPFLNKSNKQEKSTELTPGQVADPNKPMYGNKDAAKEAAKDFAKEGAPASDAKPGSDKPVVEKEPVDTKDKATAAKSDAAATAGATDEKWEYFLQAGAFRDQADAESVKGKLALQGFEATISERSSDNGTLFRVRLGPFNQLDAMNRMRGKLSENGIDVAVVRIPK
jgi:cell division protein FtsN